MAFKVDLSEVIKRKNKNEVYHIDGENIIGQAQEKDKDLFIDDSTREVKSKKKIAKNEKVLSRVTALDVGANPD
jgi:hypothetical protein